MKRLKKICVGFCLAVLILFLTAIPVSADDGIDKYFPMLGSSVPEEITDRTDTEMFSDSESFEKEVVRLSQPSELAALFLDLLGAELGGAARLFCILLALLLISAAASAVADGMSNSALSRAVRFCSTGGIISAVIYVQYAHFEEVAEFFDKLQGLMGTMLPISAVIWAMGGNVSTAGVGSAVFEVMLHVCRAVWSASLVPVCCVLSALGFCDVMCEEMRTGKIMRAVKRAYSFILGLSMTVLLFSLSVQTVVASSADSMAARTAKLVGANVIPGIGGGVSETFRTVGAGVVHLKNVFGIGGIIMLCLLVLPTLISLLLARFSFMLAAGVGEMLGCESESRLLENLCEIYGCMLSVVAASSAVFVIALFVFMQSTVAVM